MGDIHGGETPTLLKMRVDGEVGKGTNLIFDQIASMTSHVVRGQQDC